jgi:hypothetical protein
MGKLRDLDKQKILADFHSGATQGAMAEKYKLSKSTVNALCKGVAPMNVEHIKNIVKAEEALRNQHPISARVARDVIEEKLNAMEFFREASLTIAKKALAKAEEDWVSMFDLEKAQNIIGKGKENVFGKSPDTAVQINNNTAQPKTDVSHLTLEEKKAIRNKLFPKVADI